MNSPKCIRGSIGAVASGLLITQFALTGCSSDDDGATATTTQSTSATSSTEPTSSTTSSTYSASSAPPSSEEPDPNPVEEQVPEPAPEPESAEAGQTVDEPPVEAPAEPPVEQPPVESTGPQLGDSCIGADIGLRAVDASGAAIMCDNYMWQLDQGQEPSHPWVDEQIAWSECIAVKTAEECRAELDGQ